MTDSNIIQYIFDDNTIRPDGLVSITALANAYFRANGVKRDAFDWLVTKEAKHSIAYLASHSQIPQSELVVKIRGGKNGGTWIHLDLVEKFKTWLNKATPERIQQGVYLIRCSETFVFKVGISQHLPTRLKALQTAYPFELECLRFCLPTEGTAQGFEKRFHSRLKKYQLMGEWFCPDGIASAFSLFDSDEKLKRIEKNVWNKSIDWKPLVEMLKAL